MTVSFSISIMGEERILTEALAIALGSRGLVATAIGEACEAPHRLPLPEVVILVNPGPSGRLRMRLDDARAAFPQAAIIVLGGAGDEDLPNYFLQNESRCLLAADSFERLLRTIETLRNSDSPGPRTIEFDTMGRLDADASGPDSDCSELTVREQEIFKLISAGLSNKEIANFFSISPCTVKNHVHSILTKLKIRRRRYALGLTYVARINAREAVS
jgi:two-component system nitrate/nitrite response regulator NarL